MNVLDRCTSRKLPLVQLSRIPLTIVPLLEPRWWPPYEHRNGGWGLWHGEALEPHVGYIFILNVNRLPYKCSAPLPILIRHGPPSPHWSLSASHSLSLFCTREQTNTGICIDASWHTLSLPPTPIHSCMLIWKQLPGLITSGGLCVGVCVCVCTSNTR